MTSTATAVCLSCSFFELSSQELGDANQGLRKQTLALEEKISQINEMQRQLVMQEKMASLGGLTVSCGLPMRLKTHLTLSITFRNSRRSL